ncbi:unnamed protein product, partial [Meganyctiphanes norvegica]
MKWRIDSGKCLITRNQNPQAALQAGIIVQQGVSKKGTPMFLCKLCKQPFIEEVKIHIRKSSHKNIIAWEAVKNASTSPHGSYLLSCLPKVVKKAMQSGEIQAQDRSKFSYMCKVCSGKEPFSGLQPLEDHLNGKDHNKSKNAVQMNSSTPISTTKCSSATQKALVTDSAASAVPLEVLKLIRDNTVRMSESNGIITYTCLACNNMCMTGVTPLLQHLKGKNHKKNEAKKACLAIVPDSAASVLPSEVQRLLQDGTIIILESNGIKSFKCCVCENMSTGVEPLMEHIRGKNHKKNKIQKALVTDAQGFGLTQPSENIEVNTHESTKKKEFPTKKMKNQVVVLNYIVFPSNITNRQGADKDSENLKQAFTNIGYNVVIHTNLHELATEHVLNQLQGNTSMESLILIILSHGNGKYCFYTSDGATMDLDKIRKKFTDRACPQLKGKPKIFLSNFCRGQDIELQTDNSARIEIPHHMVTIHASVEDIMVLRHPRNGTIFISSLCKVLELGQDLREMYNKLYIAMKDEGGTTPMMETFAPFPDFTFC